MTDALTLVRRLEASIGSNLAELTDKEAIKAELDRALLPFRVAAAAWAGGVMLGPEKCDDLAYAQLLKSIGETGRAPDAHRIGDAARPDRSWIGARFGAERIDRALKPQSSRLPRDSCPVLTTYLPEVFYPVGVPHGRQGSTRCWEIHRGMRSSSRPRSSSRASTSRFLMPRRSENGRN